MKFLHRVASISAWIFRRDRAEARLDAELQAMVDLSAADKMRDGTPADEARRQARIELGGVEQVKEEVRSRRHGHLLDEIARDLRYATRMFARTPGFTIVIVLTLALGIGVNTAIFSLIDALMLRSLPVRHAQDLVQVNLRERGATDGGETFSYAIVRALDEQRDVFAGAAGFTSHGFDLATGGSVTRVSGALVTGAFYETLGLEAAAGRVLTRADDEPGAPLVAVMSDAFWARQFARSPDAIGRTLGANGVAVTIVGVTPAGFTGANVGSTADLTMAAAALSRLRPGMSALLQPGNFWLRVLARPRPGVSPDRAASRLNALWPAMADRVIAPHWPAARRQTMAESTFVFAPGATGWTGLRDLYQRPLYVLMAAVALILLIACANVASLLLARASARQREMAVRLAIGAGRRRIVRQLLIESTMLSMAGAALGVALAWISSRVLVDLIAGGPGGIVFDLTPNGHVLAFAIGAAVATGVLFGLAPLRHIRMDAFASVHSSTRTMTRRSRLLPALVAVQVALSLVLLAGAGLFARTLTNLRRVDPGFSTDGTFVVPLERRLSPTPAELLEVVQRVPGVTMASLTTHTPLDGAAWTEPVVPAGQPIPENDNARMVAADPRFFEAMQIPLVAGRGFTDADARGGARVAVINERYAAREFPGQSPVGRHLATKLMGSVQDLEIVGVARNAIFSGLRRGPTATVYIPFGQFEGSLEPSLVVRVASLTGSAARDIRAALQSLLPTSLIEVRELSAQVSSTMVRERMMASLAGAFGVLALLLASIGLYGLLAYNVAQRSREIGIRMALGSRESSVIGLILRKAGLLVVSGLVLGLPAAWAASRWVESMLFGLRPMDPLVIGGAIGLLVASALVAAYAPARRAARVDPLIVLKQE